MPLYITLQLRHGGFDGQMRESHAIVHGCEKEDYFMHLSLLRPIRSQNLKIALLQCKKYAIF